MSSAEVVDISVPADKIDYKDSIPIEISVECYGMTGTTFEIPVYIDGDLVHTFVFDYESGKIGEYITFHDSVDIVSDVSSSPGEYQLTTDDFYTTADLTDTFTVLTPANFTLSCDVEQYYFVTNNDFNIEYIVTNKGGTAGDFPCSIWFDGELISENTTTVRGGTTEERSVTVKTEREGIHKLKLNNQSYNLAFYAAEDQKTGKLMDNTISGTSKININNTSSSDVVVLLVEPKNPGTAVAAGYIKAGEKFSLHSLPKGDYYLVFETGSQYIPEFESFYYDSHYTSYKVSNLGSRFDLILHQEMLDSDNYELTVTPRVPDQN